MTTHELALVIDGVDFFDDAVVEALYSAFEDVTAATRDGASILHVEREADTVSAAIAEFEAELQQVLPAAFVVGVEGDCLVTASGAARQSGRSRQSLHQQLSGARGAGFVPALLWVDGARPVWPASDVAAWATGESDSSSGIECAVAALMLARCTRSAVELADTIELALHRVQAVSGDDRSLVVHRLRELADGLEAMA